MIKRKIGLRIKELRLMKKLSQEKCSLLSNINRSYWNGVELGKRNISIINLNKICNFFKISLKDFFDSPIFMNKKNNE